jgi:hypothetical protein
MTHTLTRWLTVGVLMFICASSVSAALVAHYRLDEPAASTTAADVTGQHNAAYEGTPSLNRPGAAVGTGKSVLFSGDDAVRDANPNHPAMTAFSLSMWISINSAYGGHMMPASRTDTFNDPWTVQIEPGSGDVRTLAWIEGVTGHTYVPVNTDEWFHLTVTTPGTAGGAQNVYINGALAGSGVDADGFHDDGTQAFWIGRRADGYNFRGSIDDVQIYSHELTAADAAYLYSHPGESIATTPAHPGDFDGDGDVDGADFVAWQTNFPKETGAVLADGDADNDGDVDGADFVVWQTNFPFTPGPGASPVPEPQALLLLLSGGVLAALGRRVNRR